MTTNASMTIYNRRKNKDTGFYEYVRHFIPTVYWYTNQKTKVSDEGSRSGIQSADVYKIRIPEEELAYYVSPEEYYQIPDDGLGERWTADNQDLFVKGECTIEIKSAADLEKLHKTYGSVNSWSDNRFGGLPHIRIGGSR